MPIILLACLVVVVDQLVKFYVAGHMTVGMSIPVIESIFHITYILNPGAAFGMLEHKTWFFILVAVVLFGAILRYYPWIREQHILFRTGIGLQVGGAAGNLIDRIRTGLVVDFFDFRIWPVFNIADIAICTGVAMILFSMFYLEEKKDGAQ